MKRKLHNLNLRTTIMLLLCIHCITTFSQGPGSSWQYFRPMLLNPATPTANYQVRVILRTMNMGNPYTNVNSDGSDLRFYDGWGVPCSYWIEKWSVTADSYVWVKVPASGTTLLRMYYGNTAATVQSDGNSTFDFFDDFDGPSLADNWHKVTSGGQISVSFGKVALRNTNGGTVSISTAFTPASETFVVEIRHEEMAFYRNRFYATTSYTANCPPGLLPTNDYGYFHDGSPSSYSSAQCYWDGTWNTDVYHDEKLITRWFITDGSTYKWSTLNSDNYYVRDSRTTTYSPLIRYISIIVSDAALTYTDVYWVRVRKSASTEPQALIYSEAANSPCAYNSNNYNNGGTLLPCSDMPNGFITSTTASANYYYDLNIIQGLSYVLKTCSGNEYPAQLAVYNKNDGSPIAWSASNNMGSCGTQTDVYLSFTAPYSGQAKVLLDNRNDCDLSSPNYVTLQVNVSEGSNTVDDASAAGANTWVGHLYEGTNSAVSYSGSFSNYLGYYNQTETFDQSFGGDNNCFSPVTSQGNVRGTVYTETYSVRYRMNSTKKGLYVVDLGADDGNRLMVDGNLVFDDWVDKAYTVRNNVLIGLGGSSALVYDFYENGGANQVSFQNLTLILANSLSDNLSQSLCPGSTGAPVGGDAFGDLPAGIYGSYQWTYSTTPGGVRTNITGANSSEYTPNTAAAPFNTPGTYYLYRNVIATSTNNYGVSPYQASIESNAATLVIFSSSQPPTAITGTAAICRGESTTLTTTGGSLGTNAKDIWYQGSCATEGFNQEWVTQPYEVAGSTVNNVSNGILNITSSTDNPMINMTNVGSFPAATYRYIHIRYRVVSGTAGMVEIYFSKTGGTDLSEAQCVRANLLSDNTWHTACVPMSTSASWTGTITGWGYDWCTPPSSDPADRVTMELDFIALADQPILEWGTTLTVSPAGNTTYYTRKKGLCGNNECVSREVIVNALPTFTTEVTNVSCHGGSDGKIKVIVLSGTPGYIFSKDNGAQWTDLPQAGTEYTFEGLNVAGGPYYIMIQDGNGCRQDTRTEP